MIDLHTHTTASDGRCTPRTLVECARAAGVSILSVTDHDTVAATAEAAACCAAAGIGFVTGIEISAVLDGTDVHVLGYFIDVHSERLLRFLEEQRGCRIERVRHMVAALADHGVSLDADAIVRPAIENPKMSAGRPWIARALIEAGYVTTVSEAFDQWLSPGRPGFIGRQGASPAAVFQEIRSAGGITALAHPGLLQHDEWLSGFVGAGLGAIEAYHTKHDADATARYLALAARFKVPVSGGSDYHGDPAHGAARPGAVSLPPDEFARLAALASKSA